MTLALIKTPPRKHPTPLREYRCACGKLLVRADLKSGSAVEAYCRYCQKHVTFIAA